MSEVTRILNEIDAGVLDVDSDLLPIVYQELRRMAAAKIAREAPGHTLDATSLVHEAYLRLVGTQSFESRRHFFGAAAEAMRRILIDRARAKQANKRRPGVSRVDLQPDEVVDAVSGYDERLECVDLALEKFASIDSEKAELVKLRYFVGLTIREAAEILGISTATADRYWAYAKAWLQTEMSS